MKKYPNFLGIGAVRGGSTFLWHLLKSHPKLFLPAKRKEIQFFTRYYDKGETWYRDIFNVKNSNQNYRGEITPGYLSNEGTIEKIKNLKSVEKFIVILRNPVERAFSHYKWHLRVTGEQIDFKTFYTKLSRLAIENGMYFKYLSKYIEEFGKENFLILIFEEVIQNKELAVNKIANFFEIDETQFNLPERKNESTIPRFRKLFNLAHRLTNFLRKNDLDFLPNLLVKLGFKGMFGKSELNNKTKLTHEDRSFLTTVFEADVKNLEFLLGRKLGIWAFNNHAKN